jgi:hypothetical protein
MGFLLKIIILAVVVYGAWTAARRWLGLFGGIAKPPAPPPPRETPAQPRRVVVEDTRLCTACGAYVSANASKCGRADCPQP